MTTRRLTLRIDRWDRIVWVDYVVFVVVAAALYAGTFIQLPCDLIG